MLSENLWYDLVQLRHELEEGIIWQMLESEFALTDVSRIGLSQDCVAIARYNLSSIERVPNSLRYESNVLT